MKRFLLDTPAILTLRDDEAGADRLAEMPDLASRGKANCYGCFTTLMEVLYRVWPDEDKVAGLLSIADAWIAACASEQGAVLLHKDPEFQSLPVAQELPPLKAKKNQ